MVRAHMLSERELRQIRRDFDSCDAVLAVSPGLREHIRPYCTNKDIQVVPNMVSDRFLKAVCAAIPAKRSALSPWAACSIKGVRHSAGSVRRRA